MARVAWKRLNSTDHKNIKGQFAGGTGGGATYIVLGKSLPGQDFAGFFPALVSHRAAVKSAEGVFTVSADPNRRDGEWLILDQRGNRHAAWSDSTGFPDSFEAGDAAVILIFESKGAYFTAWLRLTEFTQLAPALAERVRGVDDSPIALLARFGLHDSSALADFTAQEAALPDLPFDPLSQEDGRKRILAEIVRRQGQRGFRKKLLESFDGRCAVTGCALEWVLEAAHISPYRGPATNKADNGLLLRADIHTLFDLGLLSINPDSLKIRVASRIDDPQYRALDGQALRAGKTAPSKPALQEHWDRSID